MSRRNSSTWRRCSSRSSRGCCCRAIRTSSADAQDDPRAELVSRLLEHEKFKMAAQMLLQRQQIEDAVLSNPALKEFKNQEGTEAELAADVVDLVRTFQQILDRQRACGRSSTWTKMPSTVTQMIDYFQRRLTIEERPIRLKNLLRALQTRNALVCAFLALLEMVRLQAIMLRQEHVFGEIVIKKSATFEQAHERSTQPFATTGDSESSNW